MSAKISYQELDTTITTLIAHLRKAASDAEKQRVMDAIIRVCEPLVQQAARKWPAKDREARAADARVAIWLRVTKFVETPLEQGSYAAVLAQVARRRAIDGDRREQKPVFGPGLNAQRMAETRKSIDFSDPQERAVWAREDGQATRDEQLVAGRAEAASHLVRPLVLSLDALGDIAEKEREPVFDTRHKLLANLGISPERWESAVAQFDAISPDEQKKLIKELQSQMGLKGNGSDEAREAVAEKEALIRLYSEVRDPEVARKEIDNIYARPAKERERILNNRKDRLGVPKGMTAVEWEAERAKRRRWELDDDLGQREVVAVGGEQMKLF